MNKFEVKDKQNGEPQNAVNELEHTLKGLSFKEVNDAISEENYTSESFSSSSSNDGRVRNTPPSDYDERNRIFHLNFVRRLIKDVPPPISKKYKNGTRASLSFSNDKMREIERSNRLLLTKILSQQAPSRLSGTKRIDQTQCTVPVNDNTKRVSSATINRRKQQVQIDAHNQILKRKIEKIARRKSTA